MVDAVLDLDVLFSTAIYLFSINKKTIPMNKEYIVETSKITLKRDNADGTFIMSVYDNNGHYLDDIYLDCMEVMDLYNGLEKIKDKIC